MLTWLIVPMLLAAALRLPPPRPPSDQSSGRPTPEGPEPPQSPKERLYSAQPYDDDVATAVLRTLKKLGGKAEAEVLRKRARLAILDFAQALNDLRRRELITVDGAPGFEIVSLA